MSEGTPERSESPLPTVGFFAAALSTWLGFSLIARHAAGLEGFDGRGPVAPILVLSLLTLAPALVAAWLLPRVRYTGPTLLLILAVGALIRVPFLSVDPGFSDDVYRYLWDGRVQEAGFNPYGVPPADPSLDAVEAEWPVAERVRHRVIHPDIATVYPPLLELLFASIARVAGGLFFWKLLLLFVELCVAVLLIRGLEGVGRDPRLVLLYLWHPLPVIEVAWNAHAEILAVLPFLWCAVLLTEGKRLTAGIAFGGAVAAKILPLGFGLVLLRKGGFGTLIVAGIVIAWLAAPFASSLDLDRATAGLREYAGSWYFNDLLYRPIGSLLGLDPENRLSEGARYLRLAMGIAWLLVVIATSKRLPYPAALALTGAFILFSPTVHPWYLLWVLPFAVLLESRGWWLLAGTTLIAYEVQIGSRAAGMWEPNDAARWLVYAAPLVLMAWAQLAEILENRQIARQLRASPGAHSGSPTGE
mgnify:CR=1 FL=1